MTRNGIGARGVRTLLLCVAVAVVVSDAAAGTVGYYRQPAVHGDTVVFVAEGDLWKAAVTGGVATRLTSHPGDELLPAISPDGATVAFVAHYEGPSEIYTMPLTGGAPTRRTFGGGTRLTFVGWAPGGRLVYATEAYSGLPNRQLVMLDVSDPSAPGAVQRIPLAQAAEGCYDDAGQVLYFTRLPFQGSHTKRYRGGTAQNLWRFSGDGEATALTADYAGTSKTPMWWDGRLYFLSDRDGTMNIWSLARDGSDAQQHTRHSGLDVMSAALQGGRIVYQLGADLWRYDVAGGSSSLIELRLDSDFDQTREQWLRKPMDYLTAAHLSPNGDRVVLTARGEVFVAPHRQGRLVAATRNDGVRYRDARFMPDGKSLLLLSDESGEVELWKAPANGVGPAEQLTRDGEVLRWEGVPSPDGRYLAHHDKNLRLFIFDTQTRESRLIDESKVDQFEGLRWSPDSRWLAYVTQADNMFRVIRLHGVTDGARLAATSDRFDSYSPAWSLDGKWLYFLSDRNLVSKVASPWGSYQPEPFLDETTRVFELALQTGVRSPFQAKDELQDSAAPVPPATESAASSAPASNPASAPESAPAKTEPPGAEVKIVAEGLAARLRELPIPAGNYSNLIATGGALLWMSGSAGQEARNLVGTAIGAEVEIKTIASGVRSAELSADGKKLLLRKGDALYIVDAEARPAELDKKDVKLDGWAISYSPREEWRQMFDEAWRLMRDYFYDRNMHGVDWPAMRVKFRPLVDRVSTRGELNDLLGQMVGELSALHHFVRGGDLRDGPDEVDNAALGALLERDAGAGGWRVVHIHAHDPDEPEKAAPLARPGVEVRIGDVITAVDGIDALSVTSFGQLLRNKAGRQTLLRVKGPSAPAQEAAAPTAPAEGQASAAPTDANDLAARLDAPRDVIVVPFSVAQAAELRYHEWELTRRQKVEADGGGQIGYVHLRAMGGDNFTEWAKGFYPVFNRGGLIVDVRHNRGGNIDSWILGRLMRKAWFYWNQRVGQPPSWNMQYAFRGHVVVLCNEFTASDGEAFTEGAKRLGLAHVIGTRTWGGEIWLSSSNFLKDGGIATAAEYGVFGPEGAWLIEGHGVEPDQMVDNPPHATFRGEDAQLQAAIEYLTKRLAESPIPPVQAPATPNKSFRYP